MQGPQHDIRPSASLKSHNPIREGRDWLVSIAESSVVLSSVVRVIHPELFDMGMECMQKMYCQEDLREVLCMWYSVFNGASIISNRETPVHRDHSTRFEWYDLLATVGPYERAYFSLPGVGLTFLYQSGTLLGFCGWLLWHGVSEANGERMCLAYYMRENVQRRLGTRFATWNRWDNYKN